MLRCLALTALWTVIFVPSAAFGEFIARHGLSAPQYQAAFNKNVSKGFALVGVDGYATPQGVQYAAIWARVGGAQWVARHGMNAAQYQAAFNKYTAQGYRPVDVSVTGTGQGAGTFAALWSKSPGAFVARHGLTSQAYQSVFNELTGKGYRLVDVEGYATQGGMVRYAAVFLRGKGPAWLARHGLTSSQYQNAFSKAVSQGYRLTHVDGYWTPQGVRYAAIWERAKGGAWVARHGLTSGQYQAEFNKYVGQGYKLVHVSGYSDGGSARYAAIWSK